MLTEWVSRSQTCLEAVSDACSNSVLTSAAASAALSKCSNTDSFLVLPKQGERASSDEDKKRKRKRREREGARGGGGGLGGGTSTKGAASANKQTNKQTRKYARALLCTFAHAGCPVLEPKPRQSPKQLAHVSISCCSSTVSSVARAGEVVAWDGMINAPAATTIHFFCLLACLLACAVWACLKWKVSCTNESNNSSILWCRKQPTQNLPNLERPLLSLSLSFSVFFFLFCASNERRRE